jgi:hypothetical protein
MRFFCAALIALGLLIEAQPVWACFCAGPANPVEGLTRSVAVFRGRVSEIGLPFWDRIGLTNSGSYRVKFAVVKLWKGTPSNSIEVVTRLTGEACGFPFEANKEYLVYVVREPKDLQTGICTGTKNIGEAEREMKLLDDIMVGAKK